MAQTVAEKIAERLCYNEYQRGNNYVAPWAVGSDEIQFVPGNAGDGIPLVEEFHEDDGSAIVTAAAIAAVIKRYS